MESKKLAQIEEIYHAALDILPAERAAFLSKSCGSDANLLREVESLLAFEKADDNFLATPPESLAAEMFAQEDNSTNLIGTEIGHYQIIRLIGKGGMGEVYLAKDSKLDRKVALKILPPEFAADKVRMNRFIREAKSASALNHPNIITIYEIGKSEDTHFIATEFIDGKTLNELVKSRSLNLKTALEIAVQMASALDEAHSAGIVHRDIKPDNVMIRGNGLVKVLDFGIAKLVALANEESETIIQFPNNPPAAITNHQSTGPGTIIGTADYMSPEQAKGKEIDARTDIFSFGVVLYEMMAGNLPFEGETAVEMISAILKDEPKPLNSEIPSEISKIITKCLRKNRDERYQTIKDAGNDLKDAKQKLDLENLMNRITLSDHHQNKTHFIQATTADGLNQTTTNQPVSTNPKTQYLTVGLLSLVLTIGGFFGYKYFSPTKQIESIAVMPFVNENGNQDAEYLSDGMTEMLISSLSKVSNLSVKARSSVFRYKGKETNAQTIGKELNVQAILSGRIIQRNDQIILSIELVDISTENVIWSESYTRQQTDLVSLQSQVARDVSSKLKSKLSGADEAKVAMTSTTNFEAYQAYLKGRYYWNRRTAENLQKAIEQFSLAIEKDQNYTLAYTGLADCYAVLDEYAGTSTDITLPQAKAFAERAIALDNQLAEPHTSMGLVNNKLGQRAEAEQEFKRAIELNPNYATAYHWYSILLRDFGRFDESGLMIQRAHEIDPLSSVISLNISQVYQAQKNYNAAIENTLKIIELDPNYAGAYNSLAISYIKLGRETEAIANFEKAVKLSNRADVVLRNLGYGYGVTGKRDEALAIAKELEEKYAKKESFGQFVAVVYVGLGDKDKAYEWLEKDFQNKVDLGAIRWTPLFESIRDDPRYKDLLKRMNLPE